MKLAIIGANGGIGGHLVERAVAAGHDVVALVRDPATVTPRAGVRVVRGDIRDVASLEAAIAGRDAVLSAIGPRKLRARLRPGGLFSTAASNYVRVMTTTGVRRIIAVSAFVGDSTRASGWVFPAIVLPLMFRQLWADLEAAEDVYRASGLDWTTVRAARLVDGPGSARYRTGLDVRANVFTAIARVDVAEFMLAELAASRFIGQSPRIAR